MKKGSATVVIIIIAIVFTLYATSTFADVRHLKNSYEKYEQQIINEYQKDYDLKVQEL